MRLSADEVAKAGAGDPSLAKPSRPPRRRKPRRVTSIGLIVLVLMVVLTGLVIVAAGGARLTLPVWAVAEVETRLNRVVDRALPDGAVSIGAISLGMDGTWEPVLQMTDLRLTDGRGRTMLALSDGAVSFDPVALLQGQIQPTRLTVSGGDMSVRRGTDGRFDFVLGAWKAGPAIDSLAAFFDAIDAAFAQPMLASLRAVEADALSLTVADARAGRTWRVGDGRVRLDNREGEVGAEIAISFAGSAGQPGQAVLVAVSEKDTSLARVTATITAVAARDLAAQAAPLAALAALDAPISGRLAVSVTPEGISALDGSLDLGPGALRPSPQVLPITFDRAHLEIGFDPTRARIDLPKVEVESRTLRVRASGHAYMQDATGAFMTGAVGATLPSAFLTQVHISEAQIDPEGLFERPVAFSEGALDFRLRLDPFSVDIGQLALMDGPHGLHAKGRVSAAPDGWRVSLDTVVDQIDHARLLQLWPLRVVPMTRAWLAQNVLDGTLQDVRAALRVEPGKEPRLSLGYDFHDTEVRFIRTLPPILAGRGYATVEGQTYTMVLDSGHVAAPQGGDIDVAGSVFSVLDFTQKPAQAEVQLKTRSTVTAALSILDEPPFQFLTKAGRPVDLGQGQAVISSVLRFPLKPRILTEDVTYTVDGQISGFSSDKIIPAKTVTVPEVRVYADPKGLRLTGPGRVGMVPFDVVFLQPFGKTAGPATVDGTVRLSSAAAREFGIALPEGMAVGEGAAQVSIRLPKGEPATLSLVSDLNRIALTIPGTGWSKPAATLGRMEVSATLAQPPRIDRLTLNAPGLSATGSVTVIKGGGLEAARFTDVALEDWFRGGVTLTGRGQGRPVGIAISGGKVDLRRLPGGAKEGGEGDGDGVRIDVTLDGVQVTETIALAGVRGELSTLGGINGSFAGTVNGQVPVQVTLAPGQFGTAARVVSDDAGGVLAAAGVFSSARGGQLDLLLSPEQTPGRYDGRATMRNLRVVNAPVLAELLNAISVVGILDQLNGEGLLFQTVEGRLTLTPEAVEVRAGSAIGASLGVTMGGLYGIADRRLAFQGVVSPVYLVNGIGSAISRRGEGVFGFNYELGGTADRPRVSVNPLSILTPGLLRDIFRRRAPTLDDTDQ